MAKWPIFKLAAEPHDEIVDLPDPPSWRQFGRKRANSLLDSQSPLHLPEDADERGKTYLASKEECDLVNAALMLRRPLLITGQAGTGKTSLAYAVAYQLNLGPVLSWPITTRTTLQDGLYRYDAVARLQDASLKKPTTKLKEHTTDIGRYIRLGPLGTALVPTRRPRVLLIDEIDKSDIDLPNDLLNIFEEGAFTIPELERLPDEPAYELVEVGSADQGGKARIPRGRVECYEFPFVVLTSNGERDFPPAFLRRCLRLNIVPPDKSKLAEIVRAHLAPEPNMQEQVDRLIEEFIAQRAKGTQATDQLLNAVYLALHQIDPLGRDLAGLRETLFRPLDSEG